MGQLETNIFKDKKFSDLLEEIYTNQHKRESQVNTLINQLKPLIKGTGDASLLVPLIKDYLGISIKNDEHLIKLGALIQRTLIESTSEEGGITESEKEQILSEFNKLKDLDDGE